MGVMALSAYTENRLKVTPIINQVIAPKDRLLDDNGVSLWIDIGLPLLEVGCPSVLGLSILGEVLTTNNGDALSTDDEVPLMIRPGKQGTIRVNPNFSYAVEPLPKEIKLTVIRIPINSNP